MLSRYEKFYNNFQYFCIFVTLVAVSWCIWEFSNNDDITEISYKKYGEDDRSVYPDLTLCFDHFLNNEKLLEMGTNESEYRKFLTGEEENQNLVQVDFENVSLQLKDHIIIGPFIRLTNSTKKLENIQSPLTSPHSKCFTFHLPSRVEMLDVIIGINNSVFNSGKRQMYELFSLLHRPYQTMISQQFGRGNWPSREKKSWKSYRIGIYIKPHR